MNDKDIRKILIPYLQDTHEDGKIINEWGTMGDVIMDIAILEQSVITGFEIKSDRDTLSRLQNQIKYYDYICDLCYVVVGDKFIKKIADHIPSHWGIIHISSDGDIHQVRLPLCSPIDIDRLVGCLWRDECIKLIKCFGIKGYSNKNKRQLCKLITSNISEEDIRRYVCYFVKRREGWK